MDRRNIYIIAVSHATDGFAAIVKHTISHIIYAVHNNMIPIVDLKHYKNPYFKDGREYKDNVWEYFFSQPYGISLEDIKEEDNVFISYNTFATNKACSFPVSKLPISPQDPLIAEYKKYLNFNSEIKTYLNNEFENKIGSEKNVLGIICRGTDYFSLQPYCHPIQPKPQDIIIKTKQLLKEYNIDKIYLATEDDNIYKMFIDQFGDIIIPNTQFKYSDIPPKKYLSQIKVNRPNHHYTLAKEYLLSLYILSKCKYFIGGRTSGTSLVYLMTDGFDYEYIWELGYYNIFHKLKNKIFKTHM